MWPAVKREYSQENFRRRVGDLSWPKWRPSKIVWHNTAAPTLAQWIKSADEDRANGLVPGISRIRSLEQFFRDNNHWSGCPHLFIANDFIWEMNPLDAPGVHTPSWNGTSIGIETIGDWDIENDDTGEGLKVKQNTIFATAILCAAIGLEPTSGEVDHNHNTSGTIFLHKQDWKTTHDCPGAHMAIEKAAMIAEVADLMGGGEHDAGAVAAATPRDPAAVVPVPLEQPAERHGVTTSGDLNLRRGPGVTNESMGALPKDLDLVILSEAANGSTPWMQVRTPAGYVGWVSGRYVSETKTGGLR